jgi:hypothetical protein
MLNKDSGTPVTGYVSLTNGAIGPTAFALFVNSASYTLNAAERLYITNITLSSSDGTQALITVDDGGATPQKLVSTYLSSTQPPASISIPQGGCRTEPGKVPRATASAITAAKTVECSILGYVARI